MVDDIIASLGSPTARIGGDQHARSSSTRPRRTWTAPRLPPGPACWLAESAAYALGDAVRSTPAESGDAATLGPATTLAGTWSDDEMEPVEDVTVLETGSSSSAASPPRLGRAIDSGWALVLTSRQRRARRVPRLLSTMWRRRRSRSVCSVVVLGEDLVSGGGGAGRGVGPPRQPQERTGRPGESVCYRQRLRSEVRPPRPQARDQRGPGARRPHRSRGRSCMVELGEVPSPARCGARSLRGWGPPCAAGPARDVGRDGGSLVLEEDAGAATGARAHGRATPSRGSRSPPGNRPNEHAGARQPHASCSCRLGARDEL